MGDLGPAEVGGAVKHAILHEWRQQLAAGHLTREGLVELRSRLDPAYREFGCPCSRLLLAKVIEALAPLRGIAPADDDLWAGVWADDRLWERFTDSLPDTPDGIDWQPRW